MKILRWLLPLLFVASLAHAQTGYIERSDCTTLTGVAYSTVCHNTGSGGTLTQGKLYTYGASSWQEVTDHGLLTGLGDDDHTQYALGTTSAGPPSAGACTRKGQMFFDDTTTVNGSVGDLYFCPDGSGTNAKAVGLLGDSYNNVTGDSGSASASGSDTLKLSGGTGLTMTCAAGSPDTCTMEIDSAGVSVAKVATALKTKTITFRIGSDQGSVLADTDDEANIWTNDLADMHITKVRCSSDAGTPSINLQRDDGSAANILSSNLSCATGRAGATSTSFTSGEDAIASGNAINFVMVSAGGSAKRLTITITATLD